MEWSRFFQLSLSDFQGILSRKTAIFVIMAVILYQLTGIFYKVLTLQLIRMRPSPAEEMARTVAAPIREPANAYRVIPERNLFRTTIEATASRQAEAVPQQDVALPIDLKGTVAGGPRYGFAVIEEKGTRKQRLIKVGDVIAGAKVVRIRRNAIDLLVNDRKSTLEMLEANKEPILPPSKSVAAAPAPVSSGTTVVSRDLLQDAMANMGNILSQAQIRPYFNAGVPDGFIVNSIRPGSLYQKMGIAGGDIIQEVNGRKIRTVDDVMGLLNTIKSGSSLSLGIKRRGKPEVLNYQFQ
jgi:general secretion pathway protein C